ncbi:MAG TPA: iron-siderophore ABC transporter substrate-binding protein [Herpetosiphon sp.]|uniref:Periplasmic binding protein n=1 Tax=Herpetosiphon aurantiacus (strain ATCC 23779 / DSM 785 / 114-95) TaxID=316274 RepID=A9B7S1_HERA2|nr:iron-siderophore ABC transporter substrate-binding protein [Herpetosiphon sp.]ABX04449.1 periplasmic binding protein [Herpetosiphon aurantiacus DSM 785]HBW52299.1 iron-siderophore ABC transporter substrate-binding protein [Herpetosiphon sp.]
MTSLSVRFRSLLALLALVTLAACGSTTAPTATTAPAATEASAATIPPAGSEVPAETEVPAATEAPTAEATTETSASGTRSIETRYGTVEVPATPARLVTLDEGALDTAVALGIIPVGGISSRLSEGVAPYIADKVPGIAIVGNPGEINFEAVIAATPDLILTHNRIDEETYKKLSAIAPTIVPTNGIGAWKDAAGEYAAALGKTSELEAWLKEFDAKVADAKTKLAIKEGTTGAVIRWMPQGPLVMGRLLPAVVLIEELGLSLPQVAIDLGTDAPHTDVLSLEQLATVDTDWLFVATFNAEGDGALATAREQAAFGQLKAEKSKQVVAVSAQLWSSAFGPLAADAILSDIVAGVPAAQ